MKKRVPIPGTAAGPARPARSDVSGPDELAELRGRLAVAEETLRAIQTGEVDAVLGGSKKNSQVFTLDGSERAYRVLIESMNEGALTLTRDQLILYANQSFARMVKCPLEQVTGSSFRPFLSVEDQTRVRPLMKRPGKTGSKIQVLLRGSDGSPLPALLSIRKLANAGGEDVIIGMVVTDMTDARRSEELLRTFTQRVVQAQEAERGRVARELHDGITQMLCALSVHSQALVNMLAPQDADAQSAALKFSGLAEKTIEEVKRISHNLRPSVLDQLGLVAALRATGTEFAERTGVAVELDCVELSPRLPADIELTLYRMLQEALHNVEKHARARRVTVRLTLPDACVQLAIQDDGIGFHPARLAQRNVKGGFGLLGMRERATFVGGTHEVRSAPRAGAEIVMRIPLPRKGRRPDKQTDP